jgi:hypothetical protein
MKTCYRCKRTLPLEAFTRPHSKNTEEIFTNCRECSEFYQQRKRKQAEILKMAQSLAEMIIETKSK